MPRAHDQAAFDWPVPARATDTSRDAARSIAAEAPRLREDVLQVVRDAGRASGLTADEAAHRLRRSVLSVRPRVAEFSREHLIVDSGARRPNASGRNAIVWIAA